ncbi:MAG: hypothetical protein WDA68_02660 [Phycisphaerae bacterium]
MFTIDLFKGEFVPERSSPEKMLIAIITIVVPVIVAIGMFGMYMSNRVAMSVLSKEVSVYQNKSEDLASRLVTQRALEADRQRINACISEAANVINRNTQWTDILVTFVQNMPDSLVLTRLSVEKRSVRVKIPHRSDPEQKIDVYLPARTLSISLGSTIGASADRDVREFRERLRNSEALGPKLEDIIVSQQVENLGDREIISYEMKCIMKPQI